MSIIGKTAPQIFSRMQSQNQIGQKEMESTNNTATSPIKLANRRRKIQHVQSMIEIDSLQKQVYIRNTIVDKNMIDISPFPLLSKEAREVHTNYYLNRNFNDNIHKQQTNLKYQNNNESQLFKNQKRNSLIEYGVSEHSLLSKAQLNGYSPKKKNNSQISFSKLIISEKRQEDNQNQNSTYNYIGNIDSDSLTHPRNSITNISPERTIKAIRTGMKKTSLQLPSIPSPLNNSNKKEMTYLSNSSKYRAKTLEKSESHQKINPFLPNLQNYNQNIFSREILPFGVSRRSSGKEDGQFDSVMTSQQSIDLFNIILNSSKNISLPTMGIQNSAQKISLSKMNPTNQQSNTTSKTLIISSNESQNYLDANSNLLNQINSPLSTVTQKKEMMLEKSVMNNYSNSQLRENILISLSESLIKSIKNNPELNSSQMKKEQQNGEAKVLGYQSRKDQLQEQYMSSKGTDRISCFADYLSKFTGYIMDLIFGDIPKISTKGQRFDIQLTEEVLQKVLPIIGEKLKEFGLKDVLSRFEVVFSEEFKNILVICSMTKDIDVETSVDAITKDILDKLQAQYTFNLSHYSSTCKDFLIDILSDNTSKQKIQDYMQFIRIHLKRSSIFDSSATSSPLNKRNNYPQSPTFSRKSIMISSTEQHKGISESGNYKQLLNITIQDLFFIKKTIYDAIKKHIPSLSLTNRAKILEKIEILRFAYFKEVYSLDEQSNGLLVETMKTYVQNSPPLLAYLKRPDSGKHIGKFLTYLLDSILGDSTLQLFIDRAATMLSQDLDLHLISMLEQGVKGSLAQMQINFTLQQEIHYKFVHLKRRARLTPPFNAVFYQIELISKYMNSWIDLMAQQKQIKFENNEGLLQQLKQIDYLEYFLVCSLSDFDTFSLSDLSIGLQFNKIQKQTFKFWLKGIKRIFAKLKLKQKEIILIDEYFQKAFSNSY